MTVFIYADANVLTANSRRGWVCTSVGQSHAGIPGMALWWHSSSAPMTAAYSTPLTPISLLVSTVTNPKSLPASPWWLALAEQMASVCWAAIKEGRVQSRERERESERERERESESKRARERERERERERGESGSGSRGVRPTLLCCTFTV